MFIFEKAVILVIWELIFLTHQLFLWSIERRKYVADQRQQRAEESKKEIITKGTPKLVYVSVRFLQTFVEKGIKRDFGG